MTPRRTAERKARQIAEPPAGLVAAFTMIRMDDETAIAPARHAAAVYPQAQHVVEWLRGGASDLDDPLIAFDAAADALFPETDQPAHDVPGMVAESAYYTGFAVCWLLLMAINGKDGAR